MTTLLSKVEPVGTGEPDEIELEIIRIVSATVEAGVVENWGQKLWTKNIILPLGHLGRRLGHYVCASDCRDLGDGHQGGWLWDLTWINYSEGHERLIGLPLILESEWSRRDNYIDDDFQKLLTARAQHRVMICQGSDPDHHFKRFAKQVRECRMTQAGDRYLFLCFDLEDHKFKFQVLVA